MRPETGADPEGQGPVVVDLCFRDHFDCTMEDELKRDKEPVRRQCPGKRSTCPEPKW